MKLRYIINTTVITIISLFVILHLTPSIAARTTLFFGGYFKSALTAKLVLAEKQPDGVADREEIDRYSFGIVYDVRPNPVSKAKDLEIDPHPGRIEVHSFGLSFAEMSFY